MELPLAVVAAKAATTAEKQAIYLPTYLKQPPVTIHPLAFTQVHTERERERVCQCAAQLVTVSRFESELTLSSEVCSADSSRGCIITPKAYDLFFFLLMLLLPLLLFLPLLLLFPLPPPRHCVCGVG